MRMQLTAILTGLLGLLSVLAQAQQQDGTVRKTEIDILAQYYQQTGDHSAVTGGKGTEELHDYSGIIVVNIPVRQRHSLRVESGVSYFTSASHDNINPRTITSASYADLTGYVDIGYNTVDTARHRSYGWHGRGMVEEYFGSVALGGHYGFISKDLNREFKMSLDFFVDKWALDYSISNLYPIELRYTGIDYVNTDKRYSANYNMILTQVINKRMQGALSAGIIRQAGLLNTPYHRVYFPTEDLPRVEHLPDQRWRLPVSVRLHYFAGDRLVIRSFYRFYWDTFGIRAHSVQVELPLKITNFISLAPFYRVHIQEASRYFAPYKMHDPTDQYYTSDYDLSSFTSHFVGAGFTYAPALGIGKIKASKNTQKSMLFREIQIRGGRYWRSDGLHSLMISAGFSFLY